MELFALLTFNQIWFLLPLVIAYSLVHAGTRHEDPIPIFRHAARFAGSMSVFLFVVYVILRISV